MNPPETALHSDRSAVMVGSSAPMSSSRSWIPPFVRHLCRYDEETRAIALQEAARHLGRPAWSTFPCFSPWPAWIEILRATSNYRLDAQVIWDTEDELLAEMTSWQPLPDEADPRWHDSPASDELWARSERLMAAADASGDRGWQRVAARVFEYAPNWDVHEMMYNLRHGPERAFIDVPDGIATFAHELEVLSLHPRAGTRLWTVRELGILRQLSSLPYILDRLEDTHPEVAAEAVDSLHMLAQEHPEAAVAISRFPPELRE